MCIRDRYRIDGKGGFSLKVQIPVIKGKKYNVEIVSMGHSGEAVSYTHLEQKYSTIDALKACFPAGTVSGAPKVRAMEIIHELEAVKRESYAGSVGYIDFQGNMDMCIAIRTIQVLSLIHISYLRHYGIREIDYLCLTHAHEDLSLIHIYKFGKQESLLDR